ncbi:MAG: hypothetical protein A3F72_02525 [Bacteroidetes bacterium RIFCSPLOWO2_12_FULL_35_15]|nr:MAG: hypothetical protein A3F72_02525 [Bacteroidetes bacterium RIFCSPLOWO2_12_FULL_35_15]
MDSNNITIGLCGDVMIGRSLDEIISQKGYKYPWGNTLSLFEKTDLNIINLETTLTKSDKKTCKVFNFKAQPDKIQTLSEARITLVNIANNHILDYSEEGLIETIMVLKKAGIKYVGAGINAQEAAEMEVVKKNGIQIGILGFTDNEPGWKAGQKKAGTNYIDVENTDDRKKCLENIKSSKKQVDILIVSIHWGYNMIEEPPPHFIEFAHEMIDAGADIIHGHSAHIFQGIEIYKSKLILYDTGDFIDDYVVDPGLRNDLSFFFQIEIDKSGIKKLKLIPIKIHNYQANIAEGIDLEWSMKRIKNLSQKFKTKLKDNGEVLLSFETKALQV